jgi:hypothetical protein
MTSADGMPPDALRELVREVLRDILPALASAPAPQPASQAAFSASPLAAPSGVPEPGVPQSSVPQLGVPDLGVREPGVPRPGVPPAPPSGVPSASVAAQLPTPALQATWPGGSASPGNGTGPQPVRLATDEELHAFVLRVLALADNPKRRRDLVAGRLRFTLAPVGPAAALPAAAAPVVITPALAGGGGAPATLAPAGHSPVIPAPVGGGSATGISGDHRIEKGAVTERTVQAAATAGARLVLGPRAVLTPLARDRARALGVPIEKER